MTARQRQAIRNEGEPAEVQFKALVRGAKDTDAAKKGDARVELDGQDYYVEVKFVTSNTVNQVRAVKYTPLAIYTPAETLPWAVIPAPDVVRIVYEKPRGQHSELALECANMTLSGVGSHFRVSSAELSDRVHAAIRIGQRYPELAQTLRQLMGDLESMKSEFRERVRASLAAGDARRGSV